MTAQPREGLPRCGGHPGCATAHDGHTGARLKPPRGEERMDEVQRADLLGVQGDAPLEATEDEDSRLTGHLHLLNEVVRGQQGRGSCRCRGVGSTRVECSASGTGWQPTCDRIPMRSAGVRTAIRGSTVTGINPRSLQGGREPMRYYVVDDVREPHYSGSFNASHKWGLPGIHCPVCGATWSVGGGCLSLGRPLSLAGLG